MNHTCDKRASKIGSKISCPPGIHILYNHQDYNFHGLDYVIWHRQPWEREITQKDLI